MPSNSRVSIGGRGYAERRAGCGDSAAGPDDNALARLLEFARVLDGLLYVELHVPQLAVLAFDLADVDVLHDVARLRIDQHRAARALEHLALHRVEQRFSSVPLGGIERVVDHAHAVVATHGHEVGPELVGGLERL